MAQPSLLDALRQYLRDAAPGGVLNPEVTGQGILDAGAMVTAPVPGVGDVVGLLADANRMRDPAERTPMNMALMALGALPFVPPLAGKFKNTKEFAEALGKSGSKLDLSEFKNLTREQFDDVYQNLPYVHQSKIDRIGRAYSEGYENLPDAMRQYASDFRYENPRIPGRFGRVKPDDAVTVFRSVSPDDPADAIKAGDWVALERSYAAQHGQLGDAGSKMLTAKVPARDVEWAGTSADEWFYKPRANIDPSIKSRYEAILRYLKDGNTYASVAPYAITGGLAGLLGLSSDNANAGQ